MIVGRCYLFAFMIAIMSSRETIFSLGFCPSTWDLSALSIAIQSEKKVGKTPINKTIARLKERRKKMKSNCHQ